jgi:hypothetical protein
MAETPFVSAIPPPYFFVVRRPLCSGNADLFKVGYGLQLLKALRLLLL